MKNWKYKLQAGKKLRELIYSEEMEGEELEVAILKQLQVCYQELLEKENLFDEYDRDRIEENLNVLDGDDQLVHLYYGRDPEWFDYGFDSAEELVNSRLDEFYDLCDALDIWVVLN